LKSQHANASCQATQSRLLLVTNNSLIKIQRQTDRSVSFINQHGSQIGQFDGHAQIFSQSLHNDDISDASKRPHRLVRILQSFPIIG